MKVEIEKSGSLRIIAENTVEAFAIHKIAPCNEVCDKCGFMKLPTIIFDCSILLDEIKSSGGGAAGANHNASGGKRLL